MDGAWCFKGTALAIRMHSLILFLLLVNGRVVHSLAGLSVIDQVHITPRWVNRYELVLYLMNQFREENKENECLCLREE